MRCNHYGHHKDAHLAGPDCVQCGCVRFEERNPAAREGRLSFVAVKFFGKKRWIRQEVRVRALGHAGATLCSVRSAKIIALKGRTRFLEIKVTFTPVPSQQNPKSIRAIYKLSEKLSPQRATTTGESYAYDQCCQCLPLTYAGGHRER